MSYETWRQTAEDRGYTVKQVQGCNRFEALDGATVVGAWSETAGTLPAETPPADIPAEPAEPTEESHE